MKPSKKLQPKKISPEKRQQVARLLFSLKEIGGARLARSLGRAAESREISATLGRRRKSPRPKTSGERRILKALMGGRAEREKLYSTAFRELIDDFRTGRAIDSEKFVILFKKYVEIPMRRELLEDRELMEEFGFSERRRKLALKLAELDEKTADLGMSVSPRGETIDARKLMPFLDFALSGVNASMEVAKGTPEYETNLGHYLKYIEMIEGEKRKLESIEGGRVKRSNVSLEGMHSLMQLGYRGTYDLLKSHGAKKLFDSLRDALYWEVSAHFKFGSVL